MNLLVFLSPCSRHYGIMLPSEWENLSRCSTNLVHVLQKNTGCIALEVEQIFPVNI